MIGEWLRQRRKDDVLITSKVGNPTKSVDEQNGPCLKAPYIVQQCEQSLRRLGIETIDLYYAHVEDRGHAHRGDSGGVRETEMPGEDPIHRRQQLAGVEDRTGEGAGRGSGLGADLPRIQWSS